MPDIDAELLEFIEDEDSDIDDVVDDHAGADDDQRIAALDQERIQVERLSERTILVGCLLPDSPYTEDDMLSELQELAETAGAEVVGLLTQRRRKPDASTYIGKGKLDELKMLIDELRATLVVFDHDLSPSQIRNIDQTVGCRVIDRSELILDIFAGRAATSAAKLQVELAQLEYTYPRLRAMWSHLGQVAGGAPIGIGTRGPGETQIEIDRRLVNRRKSVLKRRIVEINQRRAREVAGRKSDHLTACLVGYTNAGKSTLFNALTEPSGGGGAYADNRLFATLTSRTRRWPLGSGDEIMLSDTVGFVRDLPHHLIASFRATLEEAMSADLLLIVLDVSDPMAGLHYDVVHETLDDLERQWHDVPSSDSTDPDDRAGPPRILILNKCDRLPDQSELAVWHRRAPDAIPVSALRGFGLEQLAEVVCRFCHGASRVLQLELPLQLGKALSFIEHRGQVTAREYTATTARLTVRIGANYLPQLRAMGVTVLGELDSES
ncbi:MAG: GTPase HflX [Planctomycetes bacterium]|nr:GTPase HflX [Planctomycetota bacterium]